MSEGSAPRETTGCCLCGAVRYVVRGPLRSIIACHCTQCRKVSGHHLAATACRRDDLSVSGSESVIWYRSSPGVRRGFCGLCGSHLFWDDESRDLISIFAGTLDSPTGLEMVMHIFTDDAGDYYQITDGLPALPQGGSRVPLPDSPEADGIAGTPE